MSTLLQNRQVREALLLLEIGSPELDPIYVDLLEIYSSSEPHLTSMLGEPDQEGIRIDSVKMHYHYYVGGEPRRIGFVISNEHQISQIFLFIIFMVKGIIEHRSWISLDNETPIFLIRTAGHVIQELTPRI